MPIYKAKIKCFVGNSLREADEEFEYNGEPCSHIKLISGTESPSTPASAEVIEEVIDDSTTESVDYDSMTKADLEEYGRSIGLDLDKRQNRETLIAQLEEAKK
tara:strand:+ start:774 stop:1082 length:309 start_codon:yes stop_codon:yes gene_type:complete